MSLDSINTFSSANIGTSSFESAKSQAMVSDFSSSLDEAMKAKDDEKLKSSCKEFEGYFVQTLYKEMQKTVDDKNSLFKKSQATNTFTDFLVEEYSKNIADGGGIGIAKMMYESMKAQQTAAEDPINNKQN